MSGEDKLPTKYTYAWTEDSELPLADFVKKYKPSMVQNDGTKPWIWVKGSSPSQEDKGAEEALEEGEALLKEITARVEEIKHDASIPARSSKKTGAKGKKEVREEAQAEATEKFKEIAVKHGFVSGKWLSFAPPDRVDAIWSSLATSIVSGPLAATAAFRAKVATSPDGGNATQHLICIYMPNVYDKDAVTEVMKVLLREHGMSLSGVKSNLYTALGIDSKHASGLPSTTWKTTALLSEKEAKALKDAYFENLNEAKAAAPKAATADKPAAAKPAAKAQPKKKQVEDDPFASDDDGEDGEEEAQRKAVVKSKVKAPVAKAKRAKDSDDEGDESEEERPRKKKALKK
ncbi:hypothetical protein C8R46DRAFT_27351 [Mycena filopes]|nr:hypothetical protein C8R46DRAFT_27351 [Mycena filopes]